MGCVGADVAALHPIKLVSQGNLLARLLCGLKLGGRELLYAFRGCVL